RASTQAGRAGIRSKRRIRGSDGMTDIEVGVAALAKLGALKLIEVAKVATPPPGLPAAVALRAAQNHGLPRGLDRHAGVPASVSLVVSPYGLLPRRGICVNHHRCGTISSARRERPLAR